MVAPSKDDSRYAGRYETLYEATTAGGTIQAPWLDIKTASAGGGSCLRLEREVCRGVLKQSPGLLATSTYLTFIIPCEGGRLTSFGLFTDGGTLAVMMRTSSEANSQVGHVLNPPPASLLNQCRQVLSTRRP